MRAIVVTRHGGPEVLEVADLEDPVPGPGEVKVEVAASGVNFIDIYEREGVYPKEPPFVAGSEGAGTVSGVGPAVTDVAVGDRVAWAMAPGGGYAETVVVPADRVVPVPEPVALETAAWEALPRVIPHARLIVNTTSLGMAGQPPLVLDLSRAPRDAIVADIVYVPLETSLLAQARARGLRAVDGLGMLLHQAAPGFERWFGKRPQVSPALRAVILRTFEA